MARTILLGLLMSIATTAAATGTGMDVKAKPFASQDKVIRAELANGDTYREISSEDRLRLTSLLDKMGSQIEAAGGVDNLAPQALVEVFNDQESVNAILTRAAEDSRMVCKRVKRTGSNFTSNYCRTVAQQRREAEASRDYVRRLSPSVDNSMVR